MDTYVDHVVVSDDSFGLESHFGILGDDSVSVFVVVGHHELS